MKDPFRQQKLKESELVQLDKVLYGLAVYSEGKSLTRSRGGSRFCGA